MWPLISSTGTGWAIRPAPTAGRCIPLSGAIALNARRPQRLKAKKANEPGQPSNTPTAQQAPVIVHTAPIRNRAGDVELVVEIAADIAEVNRLKINPPSIIDTKLLPNRV